GDRSGRNDGQPVERGPTEISRQLAGCQIITASSVSSVVESDLMGLPWLNVIDTLLDVANLALTRKLRSASQESESSAVAGRSAGQLEARMTNVVVAALKEAFDRDARRLELERDQAEGERLRAERMLKLELLRQAGDREIGRLRL